MSNSVQNTISNSWSLLAFAKKHGKMQVGEFANKETGETFKSCIFTDPLDSNTKVFVSFSSNLGSLTPREIANRKDDLQVIQFEESGNYCLCCKGEGGNAWQDVDLGI